MPDIENLNIYLTDKHADFKIIKHKNPILSLQDAKQYFDIDKSAPVLILESESKLLSLITTSTERIDFKKLNIYLNLSKLKFADKTIVEENTGYKIGSIPLVGLNLPCIFDERLLKYDYIFGGTGNELYTLKINPKDVKKLNNVIYTINADY
ncbi:Cys-tRNA(Pro) deacylase, prolyl-tRNA editing enzyme YbaK/EbsC [Anaerosphaera aminiphila DSM 21120]|uniref:Cys-tRNA(Pro) deacylase, prolyl-tRNA editing enzyme YbaK/EbsC n=1 Tax=Anaerosphaera aminiphila DSM 21120 TaxID=1120995 RepID=A0A1M5TVF3_9FIRM|nr:YbaK/EbsC family protein [Anaerosphaera aminiphila]SHH54795.1 Cys-tRNA(Pro) deacylase, prolyl-tRNA editing enzyme YbaK/EbsC [Anaerosphaera aminiphila DSM 21120]